LVLAQNLLGFESLGGRRVARKIDIPAGSECVNQVKTATFHGHRVSLPGDAKKDRDHNSVVILYDNNGMVAGVQARFPYSKTKSPTNTFKYDEVPMFQTETIDGEDYFVLTAYTVDPSIICGAGRSSDDLETNFGTGDRLWFQNGPMPTDILTAPKIRQDALDAGYSDNNCFEGMGTHSFYKVEQYAADNCNTIVPMFLLYNHANYLIGFGFSWTGRADSKYFEKPPALAVKTIVGKMAPKCLTDGATSSGSGVSTMHVFFVRRNPSCIC
jgi:charged multivesicular body protein 7